MDENRRQANEKRAAIMAETRRDVDAQLAAASGRLKAQAAEARVQLEQDADALGEAIVERVLGRKRRDEAGPHPEHIHPESADAACRCHTPPP